MGFVMSDDYSKYRGRCKEVCKSLMEKDSTLKLKRGHYICPYDGEQGHWWLEDAGGNIVDPTVRQFKSDCGEYVELNTEKVPCEMCGLLCKLQEMKVDGRYAYCSGHCLGVNLGVI